ncbi:MAG TPA: DoxX family protein [Methylocella sp.]|nr:DoxX family protein [Methylocella sp.]
MNLQNAAALWQPRLLSILRIMTALLLLQHGTAKLFGFPHVAMFDGLKLFSLLGVAGILEFLGGLLLLVGLFTRPAAFVLSGFTAAAYFIAHAQKSFFPILNGGELAVLFCFVLLYLAAAGGGAWSADNLRVRMRPGSTPPST